MKLNFACPLTGAQKVIEVDDEKKLAHFYDRRMGQEMEADFLGDEFKGYIVKISGGNDKQGFPMKQGVLTSKRVRLLLAAGHSCYRPRRRGERRRKSVRGCVVSPDLAVLNLVITQKGEGELEGLTDKVVDKRLGPKRASNIRKLFNLTKEDDVRQYVLHRKFEVKGKTRRKAPKIQRLVTPRTIQRKKRRIALKKLQKEKVRKEEAEYTRLLKMRNAERRKSKKEEQSKRKSRRSKVASKVVKKDE